MKMEIKMATNMTFVGIIIDNLDFRQVDDIIQKQIVYYQKII